MSELSKIDVLVQPGTAMYHLPDGDGAYCGAPGPLELRKHEAMNAGIWCGRCMKLAPEEALSP